MNILLESYKDVVAYAKRYDSMWFIDWYAALDQSKTKKYILPMLLMIKRNGYTSDDFSNNHGVNNNNFEDAFDWYCQNEGKKFKKDTYQFKTLDEFLDFVATQQYKPSKKEKKSVAQSQMIKLFDNSKAMVIRIKGKMASCVYGYGTKWCITQKNQEYFESYVLQGYTFYFVFSKILRPSDTMFKVAIAVDINRHWHVFDALDKELSNENETVDNFLDQHEIPYDLFKYEKTTYLSKLIDVGYATLDGDSLTLNKPESIDTDKINKLSDKYKIIYKNYKFEIGPAFDFTTLNTINFIDCSFMINDVDANTLAPYMDLILNKTGKSTVVTFIRIKGNLLIENTTLKELRVYASENVKVNNVIVTKLFLLDSSVVDITNVTIDTGEFRIKGGRGTVDGMAINNSSIRFDSTEITFGFNIKTSGNCTGFIINYMKIPQHLLYQLIKCDSISFTVTSAEADILKFNPELLVNGSMFIDGGHYNSIENFPKVLQNFNMTSVKMEDYGFLQNASNAKTISIENIPNIPIGVFKQNSNIVYDAECKFTDLSIDDSIETIESLNMLLTDDVDVFSKINKLKKINNLYLDCRKLTKPPVTPLTLNEASYVTIKNLSIKCNDDTFGIKTIIDVIIIKMCSELPNLINSKIKNLQMIECDCPSERLSDYISSASNIELTHTHLKEFGKFKCDEFYASRTQLTDKLTVDNMFICDDSNTSIGNLNAGSENITPDRFNILLKASNEKNSGIKLNGVPEDKIKKDEFGRIVSAPKKTDDGVDRR